MPGAGTLRIELGSYGAGQTSFTPKAGATAVDIAVAATDTLADVRDKINAAGAGVTALIMTDASGSRLLIRSNTSGAANAFRTSGIASLAFDPSAGVTHDDAEPDRRRRARRPSTASPSPRRATRSRTSSTA